MGFLEIKGLGKVHYHEYGYGKKLLFAFHGYGLNGKQFDVLEQSFLQQYHVVGFDHFFHGTSTLEDAKEAYVLAGMQPELLKAYVKTWFEKYGEQRFSIIGYSIGANMALFSLEHFAEYVDEIILIAPDGLVLHKGFHFLHTSFIGKKLFRKLTYSNWMMLFALKLLRKLKIIDKSLYTIASHEVDTPEKRLDAYFTINFIKTIRPDIKRIAKLINQYHIRCRLYFGQYDDLFPQRNATKFIAMLNQPELYILPMGHWLVTSELDEYIAKQTA
jgi:pimeloyl-ACP methyl ester carboxylesterase